MDIFRFTNPSSADKMEHGLIVDNTLSKMWVERFVEAGEFVIEATAGSGIREKLPIGSYISHTETTDIMIVENHEIVDDKRKDVVVSVTGRSFESFFEQRTVGSNITFPTSGALAEVTILANSTWVQARNIMQAAVQSPWVVNAHDILPHIEIRDGEFTIDGTTEVRTLKRGSVYASVLELLAVDDIGIKTVRPGPWSPAVDPTKTVIMTHEGVDRSASLIFSQETGEIERADYLFSNRKLKNAAHVVGKWVETMIEQPGGPVSGINRRVMLVNASDLDEGFTDAPIGPARDAVLEKMRIRGLEALAQQNEIVLIKPTVSKQTGAARFRYDYDVGDTVSVVGEFNSSTKMRVTEYVEIEDTNGASGYPTLAAIKET